MNLPETTQQSIIHVDATPDEGYPLRILRAYRNNCDCKWVESTDPDEEPTNPLFKMMNEQNDKRGAILDKAIAMLSGVL